MGYARQVYTQAENELNRRRTTAQDNAQRRLENFYAVCPEAEDVRRRIASTASRAAMAVLRSGNARETMEALKNENLSLRWLAGTILYTNVDYLGKLFKKETGKNFSHYVMEKRMEMAKDLIIEGKKDRIYEVAEKVGYGSNSQYFSQVFKKYTGVSPLEYREFARLAREKNEVG